MAEADKGLLLFKNVNRRGILSRIRYDNEQEIQI